MGKRVVMLATGNTVLQEQTRIEERGGSVHLRAKNLILIRGGQ